jgi:putative membrane-bound dehydrogenase-like protein
MRFDRIFSYALFSLWSAMIAPLALGQGTNDLPYHQDKQPGPALSPEQAIAKMQLPPGFKIECVAHEPEVINPTSFTFDDQGRIWITESFEYPRASAGPGNDRIKILESTKHDGHFDKVTIFKEGLNIPCGLAMGNGGVYVTNSPDVLFLQDSTGSGKADRQQVILSGFGRSDRHELPNSLTWGPDGWLYGMNGVFNDSRIPFGGKTYDFTCAIWRYHPVFKKFELYAQGTSNPWGLDYNRQGDWFVSCCVIDHLFHMTQSGYYLRQGGPYPPQTHWLPSITTQHHQMAAYAGLCYYDADNFPEEYRGTLLMGNLHGSAINRDTLTRNGSTYAQHNAPDFAQANDAWFIPVSQKIGPDGCLYLIDWYDRYHCYQDANRDPKGVDRERGRIYRISYGDTPHYGAFDMQKSSPDELIKLLDHPNVWWRRTAQRILNEKFQPTMVPALQKMALESGDKNNGHIHALWLLVSQHAIDPQFQLKLLASADEPTRNWGVRAAGELGEVSDAVYDKLKALADDPSPDVRLQVVIAAGRLNRPDGLPLLIASLDHPKNVSDPLIPTIIYNNIKPMLRSRGQQIVDLLEKDAAAQKNFGETIVRWIREANNALARTPRQIAQSVGKALEDAAKNPRRDVAPALEEAIDGFVSLGVKPADRAQYFDPKMREQLAVLAAAKSGSARVSAAIMGMWWNDPKAADTARKILSDGGQPVYRRSNVLRALAEKKDPANIAAFADFVNDPTTPVLIRQEALNALGELDNPQAAQVLIKSYPTLSPIDLKPMAFDALVRSKAGAAAVLDAIQSKQISSGDLNENQARRIASLNDQQLTDRLTHEWGTVRMERDPERAKLVDQYKKLIQSRPPGNPIAGMKVFAAKCMQCHTIYGKGGAVGPDLSGVGRDNLYLVLSNVLDPNLVVGKPYYQWIVRLKNGTTATGLLAEESEQRVVLKDGTQQIAIPRSDIDKMKETTLSMMPEGLEKTISEQEFVDLISFLLTRQPPGA